jgi:trimeric autotransporter adhesin
MKTKTMTTLHSRKSLSRSPLRLGLPRAQPIWIIRGFLLIPLALAWFALSPTARAVLPPPAPDGGYPNANTAEGTGALQSLTTGVENTANGDHALYHNTTGTFNTATGANALFDNRGGGNNTANGFGALSSNTAGANNTATGASALANNTTISGVSGRNNTATGQAALFSNTTGVNNTADGFEALLDNTTGIRNTATGVNALFSNTTGGRNTANGFDALFGNTGSNNIGLGNNAGINLTTGSNNIDIGNVGAGGESNTIRIGSAHTRTFINGISGAVVSGAAVVVNAGGQLGVAASSARFKDAIKPMDKASEAILALKPVTFRYKKELDPESIPQFGLIAEDVAKVNPDLVARDAKGEVYTVRYEAVNAMLLNEFLKEHRKVEQQEATIARQQKQIEALTTGLQKVSDQLEVSKPARQMVSNNQ